MFEINDWIGLDNHLDVLIGKQLLSVIGNVTGLRGLVHSSTVNSYSPSQEELETIQSLAQESSDFYRATLCVSPVFADVARCLSVCPSITFVYCIQTSGDIVKLLSRRSSPIILVVDS